MSNIPVVRSHIANRVAGLVIGSDGVFTGLDEDQAVDAARSQLDAGRSHTDAAVEVVNRAMAATRRRSGNVVDNCTAIVATLH